MPSLLVYSISKGDNDLVHVPARLNLFVPGTQLNGPFGITLQVDKGRNSFQAGEGKHLVHHLEYQGHLIKGKTLSNTRLG